MAAAIAFHLEGMRSEGLELPAPHSSSMYVDIQLRGCLHPSALRAADLLQRHARSPAAPCVWLKGGGSGEWIRELSRGLELSCMN